MNKAPERRVAPGTLVIIAAVLIIAAIALGFVAYTCISTSQYTYYTQHLSEWEANTATALEQVNTSRESGQNAAVILMNEEAASGWQVIVKDAKSYLTLHRLGAAALLLACVFCVAIAVWLFISVSKQKKLPPAESKPEEVQTEQT